MKTTQKEVIQDKDYWFKRGSAFAYHTCGCEYCKEKEREILLELQSQKKGQEEEHE